MKTRLLPSTLLLVVFAALPGCDNQPFVAEFEPNMVFAYQMGQQAEQPMDQALSEATHALTDLFGTPDDPKVPEFIMQDERFATLVSMDNLIASSGSSADAGRGLYRQHCATCHGVTGNGRGPTAALVVPYPRDYRLGRFKFKSTPIGTKPTKQDISYLIKTGIQGTSMVPIPELTDDNITALTDYVIYLSWRGEVERSLLYEAGDLDFEDNDSLYDPSLKATKPDDFDDQWEVIEDYTTNVAKRWMVAGDRVKNAPERNSDLVPDSLEEVAAAVKAGGDSPVKESIARGQKLFVSEKAACFKCHGNKGRGDGQTVDYDEWTKDWTKKFGLEPADVDGQVPLIARGALPVRMSIPRNFEEGVFHGGKDPDRIYQRIALGIEGTPMPAAAVTEDEIWDLVNFVRSLYVPPKEEVGREPSG